MTGHQIGTGYSSDPDEEAPKVVIFPSETEIKLPTFWLEDDHSTTQPQPPNKHLECNFLTSFNFFATFDTGGGQSPSSLAQQSQLQSEQRGDPHSAFSRLQMNRACARPPLFWLTERDIAHRSRGSAPRPAHSLRDTRPELVHVKELSAAPINDFGPQRPPECSEQHGYNAKFQQFPDIRATNVYLNGLGPAYIHDMVKPYTPARSASLHLPIGLLLPHYELNTQQNVCELPNDIMAAESCVDLHLQTKKTHLF
ncbi:unnamed protein product [Pleuronectes platessa]|uniref:Uncharacterized protein n=1 Tax=Pleuronectes platessa TaxID=8262 RepID=A0A9N7UVK9_PLEPL|nr:unnamed protein product [Pleuronectes platessa]